LNLANKNNSEPPSRKRADVLLVERGLFESRARARAAIEAGFVVAGGKQVLKASETIAADAEISAQPAHPWVSRGGVKLAGALEQYPIEVEGHVCLDVGASTGGFTDCLLQHGAARVYAVDVGQGQLAWKLRGDPRVVVMEKTNARHLQIGQMPPPFAPADLAVIDCSFISLKKILPTAIALLKTDGKIVALVKPQFEAGKAEADKGRGVITDSAVHERVLKELKTFVAAQNDLNWRGVTESPLLGPAGNKEFLVLIEKTS